MADPSLTVLLQRFSAGDRNIAEVVLQAVLPELHRIAERQLRDERYLAPVQATELIDEVWLRSLGAGGWRVNDRGHFYAIAGIAMRRVLIDYARQRRAQRRGDGDAAIPIDSLSFDLRSPDGDVEKIVELGMLMEKLQDSDPQTAVVVDMHYFAGFTLEEIAEKTNLRCRQVRHRWEKGMKWLKDRI